MPKTLPEATAQQRVSPGEAANSASSESWSKQDGLLLSLHGNAYDVHANVLHRYSPNVKSV